LIVWTEIEMFVVKDGNYRKTSSSFEWLLQYLPIETAVSLSGNVVKSRLTRCNK
jgi:hypothetical protein